MGYNSALIIPDQHYPFAHQDIYPFLKEIKKKYKPELIINLGDEIDGHFMSFHEDEFELGLSASSELDLAIDKIHEELVDLFPRMEVLDSNHGSLVYRRARAGKVPKRALKEWKDVLETPKWNWHNKLVVSFNHGGRFLFVHGKSSASGKLAMRNGISTVEGHFHTKYEIVSFKGELSDTIYAVKSGCLIDNKSLAFFYNKTHVDDVALGCTVIADGIPSLKPMVVDKDNKWTGIVP